MLRLMQAEIPAAGQEDGGADSSVINCAKYTGRREVGLTYFRQTLKIKDWRNARRPRCVHTAEALVPSVCSFLSQFLPVFKASGGVAQVARATVS